MKIQLRLALFGFAASATSMVAMAFGLSKTVGLAPESLGSMLLPCAGIGLVALLAGWLLGRPLNRSVAQISAAGKELREGNLNARAKSGGGYEASKLAQAFNDTVSSLGKANDTLTQLLEHRTDAQNALEAELERRTEALQRSHAELESFVSVAVHDLKAPLRSVLSFGEMLTEKDSGLSAQRSDDYVRRIIAAAERMQMLLRDLHEFSLVGPSSAEPQDVDLNQVFTQACGLLRSAIEESKATVEAGPLPTIVASPIPVRLLFTHLISNALKYARADVAPVISVSSDFTAEGLKLTFSDNGMGFESKYAERIFEPFQRLHHHSAYPGTGIGLALCRKVVQSCGGEIVAKPGDSFGAQFVIDLDSRVLADHDQRSVADNPVHQSCAA